MTDHLDDQRLDREIRAYLALRIERAGPVPTPVAMAERVVGRRSVSRATPRLVWVVAGLLAVALIGVLVIGAGMLPILPHVTVPRTVATTLVPTSVPTAAPTSPRQPGEVPTNGWIAYPTRAHDAESGKPGVSVIPGEIYLARLGEAGHRLAGGIAETVCPSFSPDGTMLSYMEGDDLVVLRGDPAGGLREEHRVRDSRRWNGACPIWSPSSDAIAFLAGDDPTARALHIDVHALTGSTMTLAAPPPAQTEEVLFANYNPLAWSPDGGTIAYAALDGVWLVHLDGTSAQRLSEVESWSVSWSPDGARVVFSGEQVIVQAVRAPYDIRFLGPGRDPVWAPLNDEIGFRSGDGLVVAQADGSSSRTVGSPGYGFGGWSPVGDYLLTMIEVSTHSYDLIAVSTTGSANITIASSIDTENSRNYPDMGDVSWQPVYP